MTIGLHNLTTAPRKKAKRVGRGNSSGKGTYAGRGMKGQRSRSGGRAGLKQRAVQIMFKRIPKQTAFKSLQDKATPITLSDLQKHYSDGAIITLPTLKKKGLTNGKAKILANGNLQKKLQVKNVPISAAAKAAIEKAGGSVLLEKK